MRLNTFIMVFVISFVAFNAFSADNVKLYKDYYYGQSRASIAKMSGVESCDELEENGLCIFDHSFAGSKWDLIFGFGSGGLESVYLMQDFDADDFAKVVGAIVNNGYALLMMQSGGKIFDVVARANTDKDVEDSVKKFGMAGLQRGEITYSYATLPKKVPEGVENLSQLMAKLPDSTRGVDLDLMADEDDETFTSLMFYAPVMDEKARKKKVQESKESF